MSENAQDFYYFINGEKISATQAPTVYEAVTQACGTDEGVAVAAGGAVVPRSQWEHTRVSAGEELDILQAVQGG